MTTAAVCTSLEGEDSIEIQEWTTLPLGPKSVRIAVKTASVNFPDALMIRGLYQVRLEPPFVAGSECAGVIVEIGPEVTEFAVGDRVLALTGSGAFATEIVATPPTQIHRIPDEMPFDHAAAFNLTYGTGIHGLLRRGALRPGESVLVLGAAGGCGSAAVQIAKAAGAKVVAVAGGEAKCDLARRLGADFVFDHQVIESLSGSVKDVTDGRGVDVVFDTVGGPDAREMLRCLAWNGRYLVVGFASGDIPVIKANLTILKSVSVVGVAYGMSAILDPAANRQDFEQLFSWYGQGHVTPAISHHFPLAEAGAAIRTVSERKVLGKVVLEM